MFREDMRRILGRLFQPRSIGGWIMFGLGVVDKAVNTWSNTEFLLSKSDTISRVVAAAVASVLLQWVLLIGGLVWIILAVTRAPHTAVAAAPAPSTPAASIPAGTTIAAPRSHLPIVLADGRIVLDVTPYDLTTSFKEHTEIQRPKLLETFVGKWIKASGSVYEVLADPARIVLDHESDRPFEPTLVFILPNAQWAGDLPLLRRGQTITVRGRIWKVTHTNVHLDDCELLDL